MRKPGVPAHRGWTRVAAFTAAGVITFSGFAMAADGAVNAKGPLSGILDDFPMNLAPPTGKAGEKSDEDKLRLFSAQVKDLPAVHENIDVIERSGQTFLSLAGLIRIFKLPIEIDAARDTAQGNFGTPDNPFLLDYAKRTVTLGKETLAITHNNVVKRDGKLFVRAESAETWLGISSTLDSGQGILSLVIDRKKWPEPSPKIDAKPPVPPAEKPPETASPNEKPPPPSAPEAETKPKATTSRKNWSSFAVMRDRQSLGSIETYIDLRGTFVRLDSMLGKLGIAFNRGETPALLDIVFKDGHTIALNVEKREYTENGKKRSFYDNDAFMNDDRIFVNITLLERLLPDHQFVDDLAGRKINVYEKGGGLFGAGRAPGEKADLAPVPAPAPVQPVIIDDLSEQQKNAGSPSRGKQEEATDVLHLTRPVEAPPAAVKTPEVFAPSPPSAPATEAPKAPDMPAQTAPPSQAAPAAKPDGSVTVPVTEAKPPAETPPPVPPEPEKDKTPKNQEGEPLILQPRIKKQRLAQVFIEALDFPDQVFLPLNDFVQILEFPVKISPDGKTASGFVFSPDNAFHLDMEKKTIQVGKENFPVTDKDAFVRDKQIYLNTASLEKWLGIKSDIDRRDAIVHFLTDKKLPQEEREERQARWQQLLRRVDKSDAKSLPVLENPYTLAGYPVIDVNLGTQYTHDGSGGSGGTNNKTYAANYNIQGSADLAYMTSQFYAQGSTDGGPVNTMRFQAGRKDPAGQLLGGLQATAFEMGDITSPSVTLVTANSLGRGFSVSNKELSMPENFDFRNFTGDSVPGYEVELYRNNVLVAFQTVDGNGRYNFENIPILYGDNDFRLVFYGPQGQRDEKVETVSAFSSLLKENQFTYTLSADQRGASLIPVGESRTGSLRTPVGIQAVGGVRYGLTNDVTVGTAVAQTKLEDGDHRYATATVGANLAGVLTEATAARDLTNNGWAGSMTALGGVEDVSLRARYRRFRNFMSEAANNTDLPLSSDASLDANTQLLLPLIGNYSVGLSALRETFVNTDRVPRYTFGWRSSKSIWGLTFTDTIDYIKDEEKRIQDTFGVQTRLWNISFRAVGMYDMAPTRQFRDATFMANYRLTNRLSAQSQIEKNLAEQGQTTYGQSLNWDFDQFRLSFNGQMDSNASFFAGLNILFSFNHDSVSNRWRAQPKATSGGGAIAGRVYVDDNANNIFDDGENLVTDAKVKINNVPTEMTPDSYFVAPVTPYELARVELGTASLKDPLLAPATPGYQVMTRPGNTVVADFPLVRTTVIDGSVLLYDARGEQREISDIVVELTDKDGKPLRREITAMDGYFSFDKVPAGEYWLTVPEEALAAYHAAIEKKIQIIIKKIDEFITGKDIILRQKPDLANGSSPGAGITLSEPPPEAKPEKETKEESAKTAPPALTEKVPEREPSASTTPSSKNI